MAGTRLLLSIVYLIEIPLLVIIALWFAIQSSSTKTTKWHPRHQPFLPHRQGRKLLKQDEFSKRLEEFKARFEQEYMMRHDPAGDDSGSIRNLNYNVLMDLNCLGDDNCDSSKREGAAFEVLQESISKQQKMHSSEINVSLHHVQHRSLDDEDSKLLHELHRAMGVCTTQKEQGRDEASAPDTENIFHILNGYRKNKRFLVVISTECNDSKVFISESGSVLVAFQSGIPSNEIRHLLQSQVSKLISHQIIRQTAVLGTPQSRLSTCFKIILSTVDPDPSSHAVIYQDAIQHTQRLNRAVVNVTEQYFKPLLDKLSEYSNFTILSQNLYYHGQNIESFVKKNEYTDGTVDYTLSTLDAREAMLEGDLANIFQGIVRPYFDDESSDSHSCNVLQLVLFVARGDMTPMYAYHESHKRWSTAFAIQDKNLAVSFVNIAQDISVGDCPNDQEDYSVSNISSTFCATHDLDHIYHSQVKDSISHFASYLKTYIGLGSIPSHSDMTQGNHNIILKVHQEHAKGGIAQAEVESLIRNTIISKAHFLLNSLENIHDLIQLRPLLSVPKESAMRILQCLNVLQDAIDSDVMLSGNIHDINRKLNAAMDLWNHIKVDDEIFELPHVPVDQLFAVFGSLLLPLFVPILKNFISEIKRYRCKVKKQ